jgi:glycosyltransferase involved in cell wall biosynthesis
MAKWSLSYVLPVHNDESTLAANVARVAEHLRQYEGSEILLVENGSRDGSWAECQKLKGTQHGVPVHAFRESNAGIGFE